jgi:hypothetical protein
MASTARAPKQWCLSKNETVNSFENWRQNLQYTLSMDPNFISFLVIGTTWEKKTKASPLRGFVDDDDPVPEAKRLSAFQKVTLLELMLGQIANYCPVVSRSSIVKNSTSIDGIWQTIRTHFGFQSTGAHFIDFSDIKFEPDERPEDLFQRLTAFVEDNLLTKDCGILHHGETMEDDEEMSPSLENLIILTWLKLVNKELPRLVKQRYGTELRSRTLASIKPEISQALDSLLDEISSSNDARVMRSASYRPFEHRKNSFASAKRQGHQATVPRSPRSQKLCPLCKQAGRSDHHHFLSMCQHLPESDRKFMTKVRQVAAFDIDLAEDDCNEDTDEPCEEAAGSSVRRVQVKQSPFMNTFYGHHTLCVTIDSGAETNMIRDSVARYIGADITKSSQVAFQVDGLSALKVCGETRIMLSRDDKEFLLEALVVENMDVDVLAGVPFMEINDVTVRPAKRQVILGDGTTYLYGAATKGRTTGLPAVRRAQSFVLRAPSSSTTIWPGDYIELNVDDSFAPDTPLALEPRIESTPYPTKPSQLWPPPAIINSVGGKVRIPNESNEPRVLRRNDHFCQVCPVFSPCSDDSSIAAAVPEVTPSDRLAPVPQGCNIIQTKYNWIQTMY